MAEQLDLRKVLTGSDARIYATVNGNSYLLAEAQSFTAALNPSNADVQPLGSKLIGAVTGGYTVALSVTEYVVRDDILLVPLLEAVKSGARISYDFQGVLDRTSMDGQESRQVFRDCIPDGTFNLLNLTPGEPVTRETSFRGNAFPEIIKAFAA